MHKQIAGIPFDDFLNVTLTFVFAFCQATGWRTFGSKNAFGEEINDICMIADLKAIMTNSRRLTTFSLGRLCITKLSKYTFNFFFFKLIIDQVT